MASGFPQLSGPPFQTTCQKPDPPDAGHRERGLEHPAADILNSLADGAGHILLGGNFRDMVQDALGGQGSLCKAGLHQGASGAAHQVREDRVADEIVVSVLSVHHQVVHVEVKPEGGREIGEPVPPGPTPTGMPMASFSSRAAIPFPGSLNFSQRIRHPRRLITRLKMPPTSQR